VKYDHRAECGARALVELDKQIAAVVAFRERLAQALDPDGTAAAAPEA
jgi:hypothetical protein